MADMMDYLQKKLGNPNSLARQSGRNYFSIKPTYQGSRRLDRALTKPVMSDGRLVITPDSSGEPMASINLLHKSSQPKEIERNCEPVIAPDRNAPYRTRTYNPLIKS